MNINKINAARILGFIGAIATAAVSAISGDYITAVGIVTAAMSSVGLKQAK